MRKQPKEGKQRINKQLSFWKFHRFVDIYVSREKARNSFTLKRKSFIE
jgi:hypothetical protein